MKKMRIVIALFIIYILVFLSINFHLNLLYPYYFVKELIFYPVKALNDKELTLSYDYLDGRILFLEDEITKLKKLTNINSVLTD